MINEQENPALKRAIAALRDVLKPDEIQALSGAIQKQVARARHEDYSDVVTAEGAFKEAKGLE